MRNYFKVSVRGMPCRLFFFEDDSLGDTRTQHRAAQARASRLGGSRVSVYRTPAPGPWRDVPLVGEGIGTEPGPDEPN
jgi:hypothetical protein